MKPESAHLVAITGGIGSGKTRAASYLATLCDCPLLNLDELCRQLLNPGSAGWKALRKTVDPCFFTPSGQLDRQAFRDALFTDDILRKQVDGLLHPLARDALLQKAATMQGRVIVEIPLLFEAGWQDIVDTIVVVAADKEKRIQRIICRDNVSNEQACQAIAAQFSLTEKAALAHHVVDNSGNWQDTCRQLRQLAETLGCKE